MDALKLYELLSRVPFGRQMFSRIFCWKAPYFGSIHPFFEELRPGRCVVTIKNRRSVRNHIGSVHAIAMCNMAEAAAGTCVEVSTPKNLRWIPKKMEVEYLKKAKTSLRAVCEFDPKVLNVGENIVEVSVYDQAESKVFVAKITMYISDRK